MNVSVMFIDATNTMTALPSYCSSMQRLIDGLKLRNSVPDISHAFLVELLQSHFEYSENFLREMIREALVSELASWTKIPSIVSVSLGGQRGEAATFMLQSYYSSQLCSKEELTANTVDKGLNNRKSIVANDLFLVKRQSDDNY